MNIQIVSWKNHLISLKIQWNHHRLQRKTTSEITPSREVWRSGANRCCALLLGAPKVVRQHGCCQNVQFGNVL
jgi:hypothetical protein